jgi:hypothetical protein
MNQNKIMSTRIIAGQIEALGVNGVALAQPGHALGFRAIPMLPTCGVFDGKLPIVTLREMGPYDSADRYNHVSFEVPVTEQAAKDFLHVEMYNENAPFVNAFAEDEAAVVHLHWYVSNGAVFARYSSTAPVDLMLLFNGCMAPAEAKSLDRETAVLAQGDFQATLRIAGSIQGFCTAADVSDAETRLRGYHIPAKGQTATAHRLALTPQSPVYVTLATGEAEVCPETIDCALVEGKQAMKAEQMDSSGAAADCADAIQRLVGYCTCYDQRNGRGFVPVNRDWTGPNRVPPIFMWDNFFDSYLAIWSNPELGRQSLSHILDVIESKGILGAPPQRNLVIPVVYSKLVRSLGDEAFARDSFPSMMAFMRFWFEDRGDGHPRRDGNDDGLIECGAYSQPGQKPLAKIIQDAYDETGYDDSPMYSAGFAYQRGAIPADGVSYDFNRGTLNLTMVGQNSLYVAACRSMAVVAEWLGNAADRQWLLDEAERVHGRIRERLFDASRGYYMNRFFDGSFSTVKTMTIFYPLMVDIGDEACREKLKETLLDPDQFWGENIIPTVSRDDPAYRCDPWRDEYWLGQYWRGNIWPPTNYITYLALRNTDWHEVVGEFSKKSRRLFMDDWLPRHQAMENYPPVGCTPQTQLFQANGGRDPHYVWAGMLPMIALEQLFSVEDTTPGLRFGALQEEQFGSWSNFWFQGQKCSIRADEQGVRLVVPTLLEFVSSQPIQVRNFDLATGRFSYHSHQEVQVDMTLAGRRKTLTLPPAPV